VGDAGSINDIDAALLQVIVKGLKEQRTQGRQRNWRSPHRPSEPVMVVVAMESSRSQSAPDREAGKHRQRQAGKENRRANGPSRCVVCRSLRAQSVKALTLGIPAE